METREPEGAEEGLPTEEEESFLMRFGRTISQQRRQKGWSRTIAARRMRCSEETLKRTERGGNPTLTVFLEIVRGLQMPPFEIEGYVIGAKDEVTVNPKKGKNRSRVPPNRRNEFPLRSKNKDSRVESLEVVGHNPQTNPVRLNAEIRERRLVTSGDGDLVMLPADIPTGDTIAVRMIGDDYVGAGLRNGDVLMIKRTSEVEPGKLVVAIIDGMVVIGRYRPENGNRRLVADDQTETLLRDEDEIYGFVETLVRKFD